jgi:GT2 family glycosyltransferase
VRPPPSGEGDRSGVREVDLATFTGLLVDASALELVGGLDAGHFMMWEEYDACLRLRQAGHRIVVICQPLVSLPTHGVEGHHPPGAGTTRHATA